MNLSISTMSVSEKKRFDGNSSVVYWLAVCAFLIFLMIVLGGVTRLTHSGLSMVEWQPLMGIIPPIGEVEWVVAYCISVLAVILFVVVARVEVSRPYKVLVVSWCLLIGSQVILGILTLLNVVHIPLAAMHQGLALLVFGCGVILMRLTYFQKVENQYSNET